MRMGIYAISSIYLLFLVRCLSTPSSGRLESEQSVELGSMLKTKVYKHVQWRKLLEENTEKFEETSKEVLLKSDEAEKVEVTGDVKEDHAEVGAQAEETKIEPIVEKGEEVLKEVPRKDEVREEVKVEASMEGTEEVDTTKITLQNAQAQELLQEETTSRTSEPWREASKEGTIEGEDKLTESAQALREEEKRLESAQAQNQEEKPIESVEVQKEEEKPIEGEEVHKGEEETANGEMQKGKIEESNAVEVVKEEKSVLVQKEEEKQEENTEAQKEGGKSLETLKGQKEEERTVEESSVEKAGTDEKPDFSGLEQKPEERTVEESSVEKADTDEKPDVSGLEQKPEDIKEEAIAVSEEEKRQNEEGGTKESPSGRGGGEQQEESAVDGQVSAEGGKQDGPQEENPIKMVENRDEGKETDDGMVEQNSEPKELSPEGSGGTEGERNTEPQEKITLGSGAEGEQINNSDAGTEIQEASPDNVEVKENKSDISKEVSQVVKLDDETQAATKEVESQLELLKWDTALDPANDRPREQDLSDDDDYDIIQELVDLPTKLHETAGKVADHIRPDVQKWTDTSKVYFNLANQQITDSFSPLIGKQYAPFFASMISYGIFLLPLIVVIILFEHIKALLSLQKVLLFINIYLAAYFATLWLASFIIGLEPMSFFYQNNLSSYLSLQLLQALGYVIYLILQTINIIYACSSDTLAGKVTSTLQWFASMAIGLHYYVTVFHPAVASKPPHTSWKFYAVYAIAFFVLCLLARIRWVKKQYIAGNAVTNKKS